MDKNKEIPVFPGATHASVVRAHEKDQGYLGEFNARCYDVVRRILGSHAALMWRRYVICHLVHHCIGLYMKDRVGAGKSSSCLI